MLISYYDHLAICEQDAPQIYSLYELSLLSHELGYTQFAGDIAYLCAWLISDNGFDEHIEPNPAGLSTVDAYSDNCPIPYCYNMDFPDSNILSNIDSILHELLGIYTTDVEQTAIYAYLNYVNNTAESPNCSVYIAGNLTITDAVRHPNDSNWETISY